MPLRPGSPLPTASQELPRIQLAADHPAHTIATLVRAGDWRRVARGAYATTAATGDARRAALAQLVGVDRQLRAPHVFSHGSAALLWGLALWSLPPKVHVYQSNRPRHRRDQAIRRHLATLSPEVVTAVAGLPVTTLTRTAVDCARSMRPLPALVVTDAALRAGADRDEMLALVAVDPAGRGMARARHLVTLADAGSESPQESALRFVLLRAGLPVPSTQVRVETRLGPFWADLGWEHLKVVLEYDGRSKYDDRDALIREKRRHDALVEAGWRVLRVTKEDLRAPDALVDRVLQWMPAGVPRLSPAPQRSLRVDVSTFVSSGFALRSTSGSPLA